MAEPGGTESRPLTPDEAAQRAKANFARSRPIDFTDVDNPLRNPLVPGEDKTGRALPTQTEVETKRTEVAVKQSLNQGQQIRERLMPKGSPLQRLNRLTSEPPKTKT